MARPKEFKQERALRKAIRIFCRQGFAATSTDELMRVMDVGRQSMYDTFGDKRALFLKALEVYVTESVHSINVELERSGSALSAVQKALVTFAERSDLSSAEGCMGLNAISEFGRRDADVTRITRNAARIQRRTLMRALTRTAWPTSSRARSLGSGWLPKLARAARHSEVSQPLREGRTRGTADRAEVLRDPGRHTARSHHKRNPVRESPSRQS